MENETQKALTLEQLIKYNQEVFLPALKSRLDKLVEKKDFNDRLDKIDNSIDYLINQVDKLIQENEIRNYQERKQKEFFAILVKSLKDHNILSDESLEKISKLEIL